MSSNWICELSDVLLHWFVPFCGTSQRLERVFGLHLPVDGFGFLAGCNGSFVGRVGSEMDMLFLHHDPGDELPTLFW